MPLLARPLARAAGRWLVLLAMMLPAFLLHAGTPLQLELVVLLYRHGVRTPLPGEIRLNEVSGKPWPSWQQAPSELTPHGAAGARLMGRHDRQYLAARGLFSAHGCPDPAQTSFWANTDQRTIASAQALAQGFAPGCPIPVGHLPPGREDPLFHPMEAGATAWNAQEAVASILLGTGGPDALLAPHTDALRTMLAVLGCSKRHHADECEPGHWHGALTASTPAAGMTLSGPIANTSGTAEAILMAYAEGFPSRDVGWGRIKPGQLASLSQLHALLFGIYARPSYMAERTASVLSRRLLRVLQDGHAPRLNIFVGSDNNIVALASVLHLHFKLPGYAQDDPPIGGAMGIELWQTHDGSQRYVRIYYEAQSLEQLRSLSSSPPVTLDLHPPCAPNAEGLCRLEEVLPMLQRAAALAH